MTAIASTSMRAAPAGRRARRIALSVLGVLVAAAWVFPIYWTINASLQPSAALRERPPAFFPADPQWNTYLGILQDASFWRALSVSLQVSLIAVFVAIVGALLAAVVLSRFRFKGRGTMLIAILVVQMIPAEALFISQFRMLSGWGLINTVAGLSLLYIGMILPFIAWMLRGFVDGVPADLEEAAMVDGCSRVGAFFRVTLPLLGPGLVSSGVFGFLLAWNEYTLALVTLSGDGVTLPIWLQSFQLGMRGTDWPGLMAGSVLVAVPVIIIFSFVQNAMSKGTVAGAVKG